MVLNCFQEMVVPWFLTTGDSGIITWLRGTISGIGLQMFDCIWDKRTSNRKVECTNSVESPKIANFGLEEWGSQAFAANFSVPPRALHRPVCVRGLCWVYKKRRKKGGSPQHTHTNIPHSLLVGIRFACLLGLSHTTPAAHLFKL